MSFADEIRIARQKAFLSQDAFARELGVSFSSVNRWEKGKTYPTLSTMKEIKRFCDEANIAYERIEAEWLTHSAKE